MFSTSFAPNAKRFEGAGGAGAIIDGSVPARRATEPSSTRRHEKKRVFNSRATKRDPRDLVKHAPANALASNSESVRAEEQELPSTQLHIQLDAGLSLSTFLSTRREIWEIFGIRW